MRVYRGRICNVIYSLSRIKSLPGKQLPTTLLYEDVVDALSEFDMVP